MCHIYLVVGNNETFKLNDRAADFFLSMAERGEIPPSIISSDKNICQHIYLPKEYYSYLGMALATTLLGRQVFSVPSIYVILKRVKYLYECTQLNPSKFSDPVIKFMINRLYREMHSYDLKNIKSVIDNYDLIILLMKNDIEAFENGFKKLTA